MKPTIRKQGTRWLATFDDVFIGPVENSFGTWHDAFNFLYRMYHMGYVRREV